MLLGGPFGRAGEDEVPFVDRDPTLFPLLLARLGRNGAPWLPGRDPAACGRLRSECRFYGLRPPSPVHLWQVLCRPGPHGRWNRSGRAFHLATGEWEALPLTEWHRPGLLCCGPDHDDNWLYTLRRAGQTQRLGRYHLNMVPGGRDHGAPPTDRWDASGERTLPGGHWSVCPATEGYLGYQLFAPGPGEVLRVEHCRLQPRHLELLHVDLRSGVTRSDRVQLPELFPVGWGTLLFCLGGAENDGLFVGTSAAGLCRVHWRGSPCTVETLPPQPTGPPPRGGPPPRRRFGYGMVWWRGRPVLLGGYELPSEDGVPRESAAVKRYDPIPSVWTTLPALPRTRGARVRPRLWVRTGAQCGPPSSGRTASSWGVSTRWSIWMGGAGRWSRKGGS